MLEQSILDKIVDFFKSLGTKKASGEPIDLGRPKHDWESEEKQVQIRHDAPVNIEGEPGSKKDTVIELTKEETQPAQEPEAEKSQPAKV